MASPGEIIKTIEEQLQEHKIVTFKWISRTLKLHNTVAKQYLSKFLEKKDCNEYLITYTVFGRKENGELLLLLTKETDENYFKSKGITVVDKYIYSIQLRDVSFDSVMIYNIDKSTYELQQMSLSSINYHTEIIRQDSKLSKVSNKVSGMNGTSKTDDERPLKDSKMVDVSAKVNGGSSASKIDDEKVPSDSKVTRVSPRKKGITGPNKLDDGNASEKGPIKKPKATKPSNNKNSITSFFNKGPVKKESNDQSTTTKTDDIVIKKTESKPVKADDAEIKKNESKFVKAAGESKVVKKEETKKKQKSKKKETSKKKKQMKRIISSFDSDSEESNESDAKADDLSEPEPEPIPIKEPEPEPEVRVKVVNGKRMKRKVVEDLVESEDGFMHTTKKVVYESCDSDEAEETLDTGKRVQKQEAKSAPPEKKAKIEPPIKKKQSSMLDFLQKSQKSKS